MNIWTAATAPQRYARTMEIFCYIVFFPGVVFYGSLFLMVALLDPWLSDLGSKASIVLIFGAGISLMVFYGGESRGEYSKWVSASCWWFSAFYNAGALLLLGIFLWPLGLPGGGLESWILLVLCAICPTLAVTVSALALYTLYVPPGQRQL